jgi:proton-dependent oligopeptide transporter, POT family
MSNLTTSYDMDKYKVLGHPSALFILFFTEMWERFSYYGMRAILVLFLTSEVTKGGYAWPREHALSLYGTYTSMVYLTAIMGGYFADKVLGFRKAVILGAGLMTLGHAAMAIETPVALYLGLALLIFGNGFFKPNMTSILSHMYKEHPEKKDGAFTIFYMGVNSGAFLGIMLCGYLGEKVGWSYGFGLAGIFMFFGTIMFYLAQDIFQHIGYAPDKTSEASKIEEAEDKDKRNPFTTFDVGVIAAMAVTALIWIINDPMSKIYGFNVFVNNTIANYAIIGCVIAFILLLISRILRYDNVVRDRMFAVIIIAFIYMLFWAAFEQAGGSMTIFASDYTARALTGSSAMIFKIVNTLLTIVPLGIITWVLIKLFRSTAGNFKSSNLSLTISFLIIWYIVLWMIYREFSKPETEVAASWFSILNSFFIITLAPLFSKIWESKYNPPAAIKYAIGMVLLGIGFFGLAYGSSGIPQGAKTASVSMVFLIFAYLFHTMGELCISPIGLSYVSKLVPGRMIGFMFGIWYLAVAIGNKLAGTLGSKIDSIIEQYDMKTFFLIFTAFPFAAALFIGLCHPLLKKLMHGIK